MAYPRTASTQFPYHASQEMHTLTECMTICKACAKKCIEEGNKRMAFLCNDCGEICDTAIKFKSCDSEFCQQVLDLCSHICRQCANECSRSPSQHCQECGEVCRRCSEACLRTTSHH
jgi:hypothetical protein